MYLKGVQECFAWKKHLSQLMRLWFLSHGRPAKAQAHARLKNEFTEDERCQNLMSWLI